jgi:3D (Asp-Asp-Asp) domain-containing protein
MVVLEKFESKYYKKNEYCKTPPTERGFTLPRRSFYATINIQMKHTNIHTIIVQSAQILPTLLLVFEMIYPAPALAFSSTISGNGLTFEQTITLASDLLKPNILQKGLALKMLATAYTSTSNQTDASPFTTASGATVHEGIIATNILPIHTKIRVGSQIYTVEDRMNSRYNQAMIIDIWMPSLEQAQAFGIRTIYAKIESLPENN